MRIYLEHEIIEYPLCYFYILVKRRNSGKFCLFIFRITKNDEDQIMTSNIPEVTSSSHTNLTYNFEDDSKQKNEEIKNSNNDSGEKLLLNERKIPHVTVQAYFDDPMLPYRMREVMVMKENKQLLRHYEHSLPSW